jgi:hypothetical protein
MYSRYWGLDSLRATSSRATPDTLRSRTVISTGEKMLHQPPTAAASRKYPHQQRASPK